MAPQTHTPLAANVLGTIGTVLWCVQLVPQIWQNWRHKNTEGMPAIMMLLWAISAVFFGAYAVVQNFNIPIQIQPQIFGTLSLVTWAQVLIYTSEWPPWKATALATTLFVIFAGVEVLLVKTLRGPYDRGVEWPMILMGAFAAIILNIGLLPPYPEMWKRGGRVVGINFIFLGMDSLGGCFSLFAIVVQERFDILGGLIYIGVILLEAGIFLSHIIWLFRTRELRKRAKLEGIDFDDLPEARRWQWNPSERDACHRAGPADIETGNASIDQVSTELMAVSGCSEVERIGQLKEVDKHQREISDSDPSSAEGLVAARLRDVEKRQSATTNFELGSGDFFEASGLKEADTHQSVKTASKIGPSEDLKTMKDKKNSVIDLESEQSSHQELGFNPHNTTVSLQENSKAIRNPDSKKARRDQYPDQLHSTTPIASEHTSSDRAPDPDPGITHS